MGSPEVSQEKDHGAYAFHEKAGMSQECFSLSFLWIPCIRARPPLSPSFHPHSLLSDFRSVHGGRSQFSRVLLPDYRPWVPSFDGSWARH